MRKTQAILLLIFTIASLQAQGNKFTLIVGTYTNSCESKGIYVYEFDSSTGDFNFKNSTENVVNPSYLSVSNDNKFVYSVNENGSKSTISSFGFNSLTGKLDLINTQDSKGADPCYIINDDKNIIVANYSGGNISVFGKKSDGSLRSFQEGPA